MRRMLIVVGLSMLGALLFAAVAEAQEDPCPDPNFPRETPDGCQASYLPDVSFGSASSTATSTPMATSTPSATATASSTATASAAIAAGGSLPPSGGLASPLMGLGALMLLAGAGVVSVRIVRGSS